MAAVKALEAYKAKGKGKAVLYMTKCDDAKNTDPKTVKALRSWVQVRPSVRQSASQSATQHVQKTRQQQLLGASRLRCCQSSHRCPSGT